MFSLLEQQLEIVMEQRLDPVRNHKSKCLRHEPTKIIQSRVLRRG